MCSASNSKSWGGWGSRGPKEVALAWLAVDMSSHCECEDHQWHVTQEHNGQISTTFVLSYANPLQHFCPCTILRAKRAPSIQPNFEWDRVP